MILARHESTDEKAADSRTYEQHFIGSTDEKAGHRVRVRVSDADSFSACGEERWDRLALRVSRPRRGPAGGPAGDLDVF